MIGGKQRGGKGTGNKTYNWQGQNRQGVVKNSMGNGEAKELICMTHGHEQWCENFLRDLGGWMDIGKG